MKVTLEVCTICREELPLEEFVRDSRRPDGYASMCRSCKSERIAAGRRGEKQEVVLEPGWWHKGCADCHEHPGNWYPGPACKHRGAVQGRAEKVPVGRWGRIFDVTVRSPSSTSGRRRRDRT